MFKTIEWKDDKVIMIDQRLIPEEKVYRTYETGEEVAQAITDMVIRGAPAIGVAAAFGLALFAVRFQGDDEDEFSSSFSRLSQLMRDSRPTAANLFWAVSRMEDVFRNSQGKGIPVIKEALKNEALSLYEEDISINRRMGKNGVALIPDGATVLTHCNAGALATAGYGTALGVIRAAREEGKKVSVFVDETRPYLQGARLTSWELIEDGFEVTLITDNMAGHFIKIGEIDLIIVGGDRIAANGDVANKIGTYTLAVLARENRLPFYVAAPISTIDLSTSSGDDIPIEERDPNEVVVINGKRIAPLKVNVRYPAFDVTPGRYVTAIITERGVARPPYPESLKRLVEGE
jgi:methylthioribose-1-phosphate isomerase